MIKYTMTDGARDMDGPMRIDRLDVLWIDDEDQQGPAESNLGRFSQTPGPGAIDRRERPGYQEHEYPYWIPANYDPEYPEYAEQDYARQQSLCESEWSYQGCVAKAVVSYPCGQGSRRLQDFESSGIWGIESDSSPLYIMETELDQLNDLREHLAEFGVKWGPDAEEYVKTKQRDLAKLRAEVAKKES